MTASSNVRVGQLGLYRHPGVQMDWEGVNGSTSGGIRHVPYDIGMATDDLLLHSSFARAQICSLPGALHPVRMCSMDSSESQWAHNPRCS